MNNKKIIFISGGGSGIGLAMAQALAKDYSLILIGQSEKKLQNALSDLPGEHQYLNVDVSHKNNLKYALSSLKIRSEDSIKAVIANHGTGGENIYGENDQFDRILDVNLKGTYYLVEEIKLLWDKQKEKNYNKHVVINSSVLAHIAIPNYTAYCASKSALLGLMKVWACQWAKDNIYVNTLCPGWVDTKMGQEGIHLLAESNRISHNSAFDLAMSQVPTKKMATPKELGEFVKFLINQEVCSFTGESFNINNGSWMAP